jgi:hypothetical protein
VTVVRPGVSERLLVSRLATFTMLMRVCKESGRQVMCLGMSVVDEQRERDKR